MTVSRRHFLRTAGAVSLGFSGLYHLLGCAEDGAWTGYDTPFGYGPLIPDPNRVLDLPKGFSYTVVSSTGEEMHDGFLVPGLHDGMAAFPGSNGKTVLVRNHELSSGSSPKIGPFGEKNERVAPVEQTYDPGRGDTRCLGGTTTLVYDTRERRLERHYLSLIGTLRNCAGGPTPWNSWISCEETTVRADRDLAKDHGYNFEVPATAQIGLADPVPLKAMGRFNHEAVAVDPGSGIVYQTEDRSDGLIYRFVPHRPAQLAAGGRLQALMVRDQRSLDTRNWGDSVTVAAGETLAVDWIDIENVQSPGDDLRFQGFGNGAARFARGEGMWYGKNAIYFLCTNGGKAKKGQVWRYVPSSAEGMSQEQQEPGRLALFVEPNNSELVENADTLTVAPWDDLILCEDGSADDFLVGVTPGGEIYKFGRNAMNQLEFAGATFSPDGSTLFVNIQSPGLTLAITGRWRQPVV